MAYGYIGDSEYPGSPREGVVEIPEDILGSDRLLQPGFLGRNNFV